MNLDLLKIQKNTFSQSAETPSKKAMNAKAKFYTFSIYFLFKHEKIRSASATFRLVFFPFEKLDFSSSDLVEIQ
jgi:hypothetical protein